MNHIFYTKKYHFLFITLASVCISQFVAAQQKDSLRYPIQDRRGDAYTWSNRNPFSLRDTSLIKQDIQYDPKTKQYYILPEFDYNDYRQDFISSAEKAKMDEFFADSRKLYAEHAIGTKEKIVSSDSKTGKLFQKLLQEYYAVNMQSPNFDLLLDKSVYNY